MPDTETTHTTLDLPFSVWCLCEMIDRGAGRLSCLCRVHCHCPVEHRDFPPSPFLKFSQVSKMVLFLSWLNICKAQLKQ